MSILIFLLKAIYFSDNVHTQELVLRLIKINKDRKVIHNINSSVLKRNKKIYQVCQLRTDRNLNFKNLDISSKTDFFILCTIYIVSLNENF